MQSKQFISTAQAAKMLGISRVAVFKKIKSGELKASKVGRNYIIERKKLLETAPSELSEKNKVIIDKAIKKTVQEYGETLKLLGHA